MANNSGEINVSYQWTNGTSIPTMDSSFVQVEKYLVKYAIPTISVFGIIGNILNIAVLTRHHFKKTITKLELSSHLGLLALAVSDLLFCALTLPGTLKPDCKSKIFHMCIYKNVNFWMYYKAYHSALISIFVTSSTWLTISMAISRYLALCHPLRVREFIGPTSTKISVCVVYSMAILFNLPKFWIFKVRKLGHLGYWIDTDVTLNGSPMYIAFKWLWAIFGTFLPLAILVFCNVGLIRALYESSRMRRTYRVHVKSNTETHHRITPTLIIIIIGYILLVAPATILQFFEDYILKKDKDRNENGKGISDYMIAMNVFNMTQTINFAFNFALYCAVNVYFRKALIQLFCYCCKCCKGPGAMERIPSSNTKIHSTRHTSIDTEV